MKFRNPKTNEGNDETASIETNDESHKTIETTVVKKSPLTKRMVWINSIVIILLSILIYNLYQKYQDYNSSEIPPLESNENSIAIIPFKNLSKLEEDKFFTLGVTTSLQSQLNTIKGIKVISEKCMEKYADTIMTPSEIANEIGVTYLLNGTVQKHKDSIRVITHVINAKDDNQLKSMVFIEKFDHLLALQSNIAKQVALELNIKLSPAELEKIEKVPTDNLEAYKTYLKGRFFWHRRTEEDLNKSIYYFNQALELDSTYALAYAGLADAYFIMGWWRWLPKNKGFTKGREYAQKALSIDNTNAEAHATLGAIITWDEWKWKEAEKELKMAISLNPNYTTGHQYYHELLNVLGRNKEAQIQINIALELNPYSLIINRQTAYSYYNNLNYKKAVEGFHKAIDLGNGNDLLVRFDKLGIIKCYINLGWNELAKESIKNFISTDPSIDHKVLDEIYIKSGIDGLMIWFVNWILVNKSEKYLGNLTIVTINSNIAYFYARTGDLQNALKYLEKAFKHGETGILFINGSSDFNSIRTEPRFIALLKKMGLAEQYE